MQKINLIQVTHQFPFQGDGISDYAYQLAGELRNNHHIDTSFIVFENDSEKIKTIPNFSFYNLTTEQQTLDEMIIHLIEVNADKNAISKNVVILHYDLGFYDTYLNKRKFERFYFPLKLLKCLRLLNKECHDLNIIIMFHEFFSSSIRRRRDIFLKTLQACFIRRIIKNIDLAICSNPVTSKQIYTLAPKTNILMFPVFSNIGEPKNLIHQKSNGTWVIFGSTNTLIKMLKQFIHHLSMLKETFSINQVYILGGKKKNEIINLIDRIKKEIKTVDYYPSISNEDASKIFTTAQFCYMYYFEPYVVNDSALIFKSGIFAAACAHGVIPVFGNPNMEHAMGVFNHPGFIYIKDEQFQIPNHDLSQLSQEIFNWYQKYSSLRNAGNMLSKAILI